MLTAVIALVLVIALAVAVLAARWAWSSQRRRLDVWWTETVQPLLHPPRTLEVAALQRRIFVRCLREVSVSGRGVAVLPAGFDVEVADADAERLAPLVHIVEAELADALGTEATKKGWERPERVRVSIDAGDVVEGRPRARAVLGHAAADRPEPLRVAQPAPAHPSLGSPATGPAAGGRHLGAVAGWEGEGRRGTLLDRTTRRRTTVERLGAPTVAGRAPAGVVCELIASGPGTDVDLTDRAAPLSIGRAGTDVVLDDDRVSSRHAELVPAPGGQWLLDDADSLNGTWVNGRRVERANLVHGDEISFASEGPRFLFSRLADGDR